MARDVMIFGYPQNWRGTPSYIRRRQEEYVANYDPMPKSWEFDIMEFDPAAYAAIDRTRIQKCVCSFCGNTWLVDISRHECESCGAPFSEEKGENERGSGV